MSRKMSILSSQSGTKLSVCPLLPLNLLCRIHGDDSFISSSSFNRREEIHPWLSRSSTTISNVKSAKPNSSNSFEHPYISSSSLTRTVRSPIKLHFFFSLFVLDTQSVSRCWERWSKSFNGKDSEICITTLAKKN